MVFGNMYNPDVSFCPDVIGNTVDLGSIFWTFSGNVMAKCYNINP